MKVVTNSNLVPKEEFKYEYSLTPEGAWRIHNIESDTYTTIDDPEVQEDFEKFKEERPEYIFHLFNHVCTSFVPLVEQSDADMIQNIDPRDLFENLLAYSMVSNAENEELAWKRATRFINWIRGTNFYESPASTIYHEAYVGGLLSHTLTVAKTILSLRESAAFCGLVTPEDAVFVALVHDFCKIGIYEQTVKWYKDDDGQWQSKPGFKRADAAVPLGHGETSMYIVQKFKSLKLEPALAIRWHMGKWRVSDDDVNELQYSNENYPLVHLLQFADQLAITNYVSNVKEPCINV